MAESNPTDGDNSGLVSAAELAKIYKVKSRTVRSWIDDGCPVAVRGGGRGNPNMFDLEVVKNWRENNGPGSGAMDLTTERTLLLRAQRKEAEIRIKKQLGDLVDIKVVGQLWSDHISAAKTKLLGLSVRLAPLVMSTGTLDECKTVIDEFIREALEDVSGNGLPDTDISGQLDTTTVTDSQ